MPFSPLPMYTFLEMVISMGKSVAILDDDSLGKASQIMPQAHLSIFEVAGLFPDGADVVAVAIAAEMPMVAHTPHE